MNKANVCAQLLEDPREVFISQTATAMRCVVALPPVGNKAPTQIELNIYGKQGERFSRFKKDDRVFIHRSKLRFDLESRTYSMHGGLVTAVDDQFPIINEITLCGRCVKDIDRDDTRAFRTTPDGLMVCNQTLSVNTGRNQADLFNFFAMNSVNDKLNNAELLVNFTRKGVGLTLEGSLITDAWTDKQSGERRTNTRIKMSAMTLAPKSSNAQPAVQTSTTVASDKVAPLWGGKTAEENDPWNVTSGLPDLPGQYGAAPELEEAPF
jgi:single-stranded DNA-binding protein